MCVRLRIVLLHTHTVCPEGSVGGYGPRTTQHPHKCGGGRDAPGQEERAKELRRCFAHRVVHAGSCDGNCPETAPLGAYTQSLLHCLIRRQRLIACEEKGTPNSIMSSAVVLFPGCVVWAEGKLLVQPDCKEGFLDKVLFQMCWEKQE